MKHFILTYTVFGMLEPQHWYVRATTMARAIEWFERMNKRPVIRAEFIVPEPGQVFADAD